VTTDSAHAKPVAVNMLERRFDGWGINQAWAADLTYIPTDEAGCTWPVSWIWPADESSDGRSVTA